MERYKPPDRAEVVECRYEKGPEVSRGLSYRWCRLVEAPLKLLYLPTYIATFEEVRDPVVPIFTHCCTDDSAVIRGGGSRILNRHFRERVVRHFVYDPDGENIFP